MTHALRQPPWSLQRAVAGFLLRPEIALSLLFVVSRYLVHAAGVSIPRLPLNGAWQLLDPELLQHDLLRSLLYLHSQPPLYNLLVGVLLKVFPDPVRAAQALDALYLVLGWLLTLLVYRLARRAGAGTIVGLLAAALFSLSPAAILYENYPHYTLPTAVLLCACAVLFERVISAFTPARALALFSALAALIYLRALFQIEWFVVLLLVTLRLLPEHRRALMLAAALPLLLVTALYAKNAAITGHFATSSWLGMSLAKLTTERLPPAQRQALVDAGVLSPLALRPPFGAPERYPELLAAVPVTGVPALDRTRKSARAINYNHLVYPDVSSQYLQDALTVLSHHPGSYLDAQITAHLMYFRPSSDYPFLEDNRHRIAPLARAYNALIAGQPSYAGTPSFELRGPGDIGYFIVAAFVVCAIYGALATLRTLRRPATAAPGQMLIAFLWLNVMYVTVLGNALEMDENQRFRFLVNPLLVVMLASWVSRVASGHKESHA